MAQTKQTASKSTGGKASRKQLSANFKGIRVRIFVGCLLLHGVIMNRGFLDSGGRKNNHTKKKNTDLGSGSITELDGILNDATPLIDASIAKEVVFVGLL
nr:hypothetical protein [Tanacetum cinerariifolium]